MKNKLDQYEQVCAEIKELDRKIQCLGACFVVISQPEMVDSVNFELLSLKGRRTVLYKHLKELKEGRSVLGK